MHPEAEVGQLLRQTQGRRGPGSRGHQAGAPQQTLAVAQSHRAVERVGKPEVVGCEDDELVGF